MDQLDVALANPKGLEEAVHFLAARSRGFGHNRYRSLLARRLKHVRLEQKQKALLTSSILDKFAAGSIDEQFMDQLRLCLLLDCAKTVRFAQGLLCSEKEYVRRYAHRILNCGRARKSTGN